MSEMMLEPGRAEELTEGDRNERELERCTREVFSNPLLLKEILKDSKFQDLLNYSLVDKKWNVMARELLRESVNCLAAVEDGYKGSDMAEFNSVISEMTQSPFSGLSIHLANENHREGFLARPHRKEHKVRLASRILELIDIQFIKISHFKEHASPINHISLGVILEHIAPTLTGLRVEISVKEDMEDISFTRFFGLPFKGHWLPKLNKLEVVSDDVKTAGVLEVGFGLVQELLLASPNLQLFKTDFLNEETVDIILDLPHKPIHLIKDFEFKCEPNSLDPAEELALLRPQFRKFRFCIDSTEYLRSSEFEDWPEEDRANVRRNLEAFLLSSKDSLEKLAVEHHDEFILMMSQWNIPVLNQVKFLELTYNERLDADGVFTLEKIDLSRYFPRLSTVSISDTVLRTDDDDERQEEFYVDENFVNRTAVYSCPSVTTLCCNFRRNVRLQFQKLEMCRRMFPSVKHLYLELEHLIWMPADFWTLWPELETLTFSGIRTKYSDIDVFLLGLQEKEVKRILTETEYQGQEQLLQIVPTSYSIMNLKNLRCLYLEIYHHVSVSDRPKKKKSYCGEEKHLHTCQDGHSKGDFLFSSLPGFLAFSRMPGLQVKVWRDACNDTDPCYLELAHLKPLVEFVSSVDRGENIYKD